MTTQTKLSAPSSLFPMDDTNTYPHSMFPLDDFNVYPESVRPNIRQLIFKSPLITKKDSEHFSLFPISGILRVTTPIREGVKFRSDEDKDLLQTFLDNLTKPERFSIALKNKFRFIGKKAREGNENWSDTFNKQKLKCIVCLESIAVASSAYIEFNSQRIKDGGELMHTAVIPFTVWCYTNISLDYMVKEPYGRQLAKQIVAEVTESIRWSMADNRHILVPTRIDTWSPITDEDKYSCMDISCPDYREDDWEVRATNCRKAWSENSAVQQNHQPIKKTRLPLTMNPRDRCLDADTWGQQS